MKRPVFRDKCPVSAFDPNVKGHESLMVNAMDDVKANAEEFFKRSVVNPPPGMEEIDLPPVVLRHVEFSRVVQGDDGDRFRIVTTACMHCGRMFSFTEDIPK